MRKKKFAGVLILTAAVALGTVSPVALPNTAVVVKAETNYTFSVTDAANYADPTLSVTDAGKLKVKKDEFTANITADDDKKHVWGFGETEAKAIEDAVANKDKEGRLITIADGAFEVEVPNNAKVLAMVKVASIEGSSNEVIGGKVDLSALRNTLAENDDYKASTVTQGKANAVTAIKYRLKDGSDSTWLDAAVGNDFPAQAVEEGKAAIYEIKKTFVAGETSSAGKLESEIKEFKIINKKKYTRADLLNLKFNFANAILKATNYGEVIKDDEMLAAKDTVKYKKDSGSAENFVEAGISGLNAASTVKIYAENEGDGTAITFTIKKIAKPVISKVDGKYQIKLEKVEEGVQYKVSKADKNSYKDVVVNADGTIDIPYDSEAEEKYYVKAFAKEYKDVMVKAPEYSAEMLIDSDDSEELKIAPDEKLMDKKKFDTIKLTSNNAENKLTIDVPNDNLKSITDKVTYDYDGKKDVNLDLTKGNNVVLTLKPGTFVLKVNNGAAFKKTINFVVPGLKSNYSKAEEFINALGGKATALNTYKITDKSGADVNNLDNLKEGEDKVAFKTPTAAVNVANGATQEYKLATEVKVTIKKVTSSSPVVPGNTDEKKDDAKKTDAKKDDAKKTDTNKDAAKQNDDKKQSDSTSTTETKQSERVSAKNTKNNTVKVSEEKIAEALETGLKVMAKSGKVEFTAKALEKMVGDTAEAVTVTLKTTATKSDAKEVTKNLKGSKLVSKKVFALNIKAGNMAVKESQLKGTKINVTLKVALKNAPKVVWVMDLSTGKKVKAAYKNGKLTFKTSNLGKFVIVNK